jgi:cation diffusion facilitator family transporter
MIAGTDLSKRELQVRLRTSIATLAVGAGVLALKFLAFHETHSQAIYSDALESIVNVVTALVGMFVISYASQPVDEDHPYGHGKIEYFSAAFEGGLIMFAAILIFIEAIKAQIHHEPLENLQVGLWIIAVCAIVNLAAAGALRIIGKKFASPTLSATAVHLMTDVVTTIGAIIGIALVRMTGLAWIDRAVSVVLGGWMAYSGVQLVRRSVAGLLDAEDASLLERLAEIFQKFAGDGIIQIHHTRVIRSGWFHHIDAHVVVPEFWSIEQAHERLNTFEDSVIHAYEFGGEANFHLDPCHRKYCTMCDYPNCPVRQFQFIKRMPVVIEHLRSKVEPI